MERDKNKKLILYMKNFLLFLLVITFFALRADSGEIPQKTENHVSAKNKRYGKSSFGAQKKLVRFVKFDEFNHLVTVLTFFNEREEKMRRTAQIHQRRGRAACRACEEAGRERVGRDRLPSEDKDSEAVPRQMEELREPRAEPR